MNTHNKTFSIGIVFLAALVMLVLVVGLTQAQGLGQGIDIQPQGPAGVAVIAPGAIPVQGRLTNASGAPLNGTYTVTFRLYEDASTGVALCSDVRPVSVVNGLFSDYIDHCYDDINGQKLWLGVQVEGDPEMTPRQVIYPVPYALSLVPGAVISYSTSSAILTARNSGSGEGIHGIGTPGVLGESGGFGYGIVGRAGVFGAGVKGEGNPLAFGGLFTNTMGGIALRAESDGAALQLGGSGRIESTADSYIFVPGSALVKEQEDNTLRWAMQANGAALVWRGATAGNQYVHIPIILPGVLYGQSVTVKSVTIYYQCDTSSNYITATDLHKQTDNDSFVALANETTDRTSLTADSYTLTPTSGNVLSSNQGILMLRLQLNFANDTAAIRIGGVRVQLGH